jgi:hypothetical protein
LAYEVSKCPIRSSYTGVTNGFNLGLLGDHLQSGPVDPVQARYARLTAFGLVGSAACVLECPLLGAECDCASFHFGVRPWQRLMGLQKHGRGHDLAARAFGAVNLVAVDFLRVGIVVDTAG